jgi:general secretion pathway protein G
MTLVELIVACTIMAYLTTLAVPLVRYRVQRDRERDLVWALRTIHKAIDDYKDAAVAGKIQVKMGTDGYPEKLQDLVDGVDLVQSAEKKKIKFLRKIPVDPMTGTTDWGMRSTQDDPLSTSWGGQNVFSVYTKSTARARDGTLYSTW